MLVTLPSQILSNFFSIPGLYAKILSFSTKSPVLYAEVLHFYADNYIFGFHCTGHLHGLIIVLYLLFVFNYRTHAMCGRGGGRAGERWWWFFSHECVCKLILAKKILRQAKAWYQISSWLLVMQSNRKALSTYHVVVRPCNSDCDLDKDPFTCVWNGFLKFSAMSRLKF